MPSATHYACRPQGRLLTLSRSRQGFDHKKGDHKRMDKVSHKDVGGRKEMGGLKDMRGGSVWHSAKLSWSFGGGFKIR